MTRPSIHMLLEHALCGILAAVFLYAGYAKVTGPLEFADSIAGFRLLPFPWMVTVVALALPYFELLVAVALFVPSWRRAGLLAVGLLCVVFIIALSSAWSRGIAADCGYFGKGEVTAWSILIAISRNVLMLLTSIYLYLRTRVSSEKPD